MRITVVGDVLLDEDVEGLASRFSPDAPVPVVDVHSRVRRAGGAGLVATMLARDGVDVELVTVLASDEPAAHLRDALRDVRLVAGPSGGDTPVKTRIRANGHPLGRIDDGCGDAPEPVVTTEMLDAIRAAEAIVVADYGRGLAAHAPVRDALRRRGEEVPLIWDPHPRGAVPVSTAQLVTPNLSEAAKATGTAVDAAHAASAASDLRERWGCAGVVVTLGDQGALLQERGAPAPVFVPTQAVPTQDPCGAGDRFAASAALSLSRDDDLATAVRAGVLAASEYLAAGGVAQLARPASPATPSGEGDADALLAAVRGRGGTIVATGGCFDLLHTGHVRTLEAARSLGDCLVVCLNSDASVSRLKGASRPVIRESDRAELLRALGCVDAVVVFEEDSPEKAIRRLRPDVWVKGGDYSADSLPEAELVRSWGGSTVTVPYHLGRSTTALATALAEVG